MEKFDALNVSSKFAICGLPLRVDTYKTCNFGCAYCFANCRKVMEFEKNLQVGDMKAVERKFKKVFDEGNANPRNFLEVLLSKRLTLHCGGMSDPFQPVEGKLGITKRLVDICNRYGLHILFSTKSDTTYDCDIRPELHTFQLSVTNVDDRKDLEGNVPPIASRIAFFKDLKSRGFKVGIRIQPFIPGVTDLKVLEAFSDADHFTIEGLKIVPQNKAHKDYMMKVTGLTPDDFLQMGLLNMKPSLRMKLYEPFISWLEAHGKSYSIADNDLRYLGNNKCCCGDALIDKSSGFSTTELIMKYGRGYKLKEVMKEVGEVANCDCAQLFTSNRTQGCKLVAEFYKQRFYQKTSPFSPKFQHTEIYEQLKLF